MAKRGAVKSTASSSSPIILATEGDRFQPLGALSEKAGGIPSRRFRKDVLHVGKLSHPQDGWDESFSVSRLQKLADSTNRMIAAGHEPHFPEGHIRFMDPKKNHGFHKRFEVEGDKLFSDVEIIGAAGIELAAKNKVSVFIEKDYTDPSGNKYDEVITHVGLTPGPIQGNQGDFVAIAAALGSNETIEVPVLQLAMMDEGNPMNELLKLIAALTGQPVTDEMSAMAALKAWSETKKAEVVAASLESHEDDEPPNPMLLKLCRENRDLKLSQLVKDARITPAVRDRLAGTWAPKDVKALALSMDESSDKRFDEMVMALGENDPVKLGEQTRAQNVIALSNDKADAPRLDPDLDKRSARLTGKSK